jgi:hypothetical protein
MLQVCKDADITKLYAVDKHSRDSQGHNRSIDLQRVGIRNAVRAKPLQPDTLVIYWSSNFSQGKCIPVSVNYQRAVERRVLQEREELLLLMLMMMLPMLSDIKLDGMEGSMEWFAAEMHFETRIAMTTEVNALDPHDLVCIGAQFSKGVRVFSFSL